MGQIYRYTTQVDTYDCAPNGRLQPTVPLDYFQEAAQRQIDSLGIGTDFLSARGLGWMVVKNQIHFLRYPKYRECLTVETEPTAFNRFEAHRRFALLSGEKVCVTAESLWMLIHLKTGRLLRLTEVPEIAALGEGTEKFVFRRPAPCTDWQYARTFQVRYLDIDMNRHVNNVKYLAWAIESFPVDMVRDYEIDTLNIVHKAQAFYGERVAAKSAQLAPDVWRVDICRERGEVLCQIEIRARARDCKL